MENAVQKRLKILNPCKNQNRSSLLVGDFN